MEPLRWAHEPCESDNNVCTDDICQVGVCNHFFDCSARLGGTCCPDDGNPCTDDFCQGTACAHPPKCPESDGPCMKECCDAGVCRTDQKAQPCAISKFTDATGCPGATVTMDAVICNNGLCDESFSLGGQQVSGQATIDSILPPGSVSVPAQSCTGFEVMVAIGANSLPDVAGIELTGSSQSDGTCDPQVTITCTAAATVNVTKVDLDVDSDNNNGTGLPDRSAAEDAVELTAPGKILCLNDDDDDGDGVADKDQEPPPVSDNDLVQMVVELKPSAPMESKWRLNYNAAVVQVYESDRATIVPTGQLFNMPINPNPKKFWIEGISSATAGPTTITLEVDLDGDGTFDCSDAVVASVIRVDLDVDTNRNGIVEDVLDDMDEDQWMTDRGGIFMVNYDDDDPGPIALPDAIRFDDEGSPVSENTDIDGASDVNDIAPLVVRAAGPKTGVQFFLKMTADDVKSVHIFTERAAGNSVLWGGWAAHAGDSVDQEFDITNQVNAASDKDLGIEALFFRGQRHALPGGTEYEFDGEIDIELVAQATTGANGIDPARIICTDKVRLKVAPYLMLPNTLDAIDVWMIDHPDSDDILAKFGPVGRRATPSVSQWFQDHVQIGYTAMPGQSMHITLRMPYSHPVLLPSLWQDNWPIDELLGPDEGIFRFRNTLRYDSAGSGDYGGNLEVVPPSDEWPLGRVVYGNTMGQQLRDFLGAQVLAGPQAVQQPFDIDVEWLAIGHVDEIVSFLPGGTRGFKVAVASPAYAEQLLRTGDSARGISPPSDDTAVFAIGAQASGTASNSFTTDSKIYLFDGVAHGQIKVVAGVAITDGETVTVSDGTVARTFEFDKSGGVAPGNVAVTITDAMNTTSVRKSLRTAINRESFGVRAVRDDIPLGTPDKLILINQDFGLTGNVPITETVGPGGFVVQGMTGGEPALDGMDFTATAWKYIRIYDGTGAGQVGLMEDATRRGKGWVSVAPVAEPRTVFATTSNVVSSGAFPPDGLFPMVKDPGTLPRGTSWLNGEPSAGSRYIVTRDTLHWVAPTGEDLFPALMSVLEVKNDVRLWNLNAAAELRITSAKSVIQTEMGLASSGGLFLRDDGDPTDDDLVADADSDFLVVPVIYFGNWSGTLTNRGNVAFIPGLANVQPASAAKIVFPKPFGPGTGPTGVFEQAAAHLIGSSSRFADDWDAFHRFDGEVHCATAAKRTFFSFNWWENQP